MILDINDPNCWNKWRELYDKLSDNEQQEFMSAIESKYPEQKHFTHSNYDLVFSDKEFPAVIEIGGWKGELAEYCLKKFNIGSWINFEICKAAINKTVPLTGPYLAFFQTRFNWFTSKRDLDANILVAAHVIEHLSDNHLTQLIKWISGIETVVFEAPIDMARNNWTDYTGTHKLLMGWNEINRLMKAEGYCAQEINPSCFIFSLSQHVSNH